MCANESKTTDFSEYSICTTVYNSVSVVRQFLSFAERCLEEGFEFVVVDSNSTDGTGELLEGYAREHRNFKLIRERCSRGRGRQIAIENSTRNTIVMIDADGIYHHLLDYVRDYATIYSGRLVAYHGVFSESQLYCIIALRSVFEKIGGYPDLNYCEDEYLLKISNSAGYTVQKTMKPNSATILQVNGLDSGRESRYAHSLFEAITRRIIATRDILFVEKLSFSELCTYYSLAGIRRYLVGFPLFLAGMVLNLTLRVEEIDDRIERVQRA